MKSKEIKKIALTVLGQNVEVVNYLPEKFFRESVLATPYIFSEGCKGLIIKKNGTIQEATTFSTNSKEVVKDVLTELSTTPGDVLVCNRTIKTEARERKPCLQNLIVNQLICDYRKRKRGTSLRNKEN